jgi:hypothetical protein
VSSILDPDSFIPDLIQHFRPSTDPDRIRVQDFDDKKFKKFTAEKIAIYVSLGLCKGRPSYQKSLHLSKENIQHFKT